MSPRGSRPRLPSGRKAWLWLCRNGATRMAGGAATPVTFRELDRDSDVLAHGLRELGVVPGTRLALLVEKPSIDFVSLVDLRADFKTGVVSDPDPIRAWAGAIY